MAFLGFVSFDMRLEILKVKHLWIYLNANVALTLKQS